MNDQDFIRISIGGEELYCRHRSWFRVVDGRAIQHMREDQAWIWLKDRGEYPTLCAWCGRVIGTSTVEYSHGRCRDCSKKLLDEMDDALQRRCEQEADEAKSTNGGENDQNKC